MVLLPARAEAAVEGDVEGVDNCEHLVNPVAATVERVLEAGPGVRVLATSRQPIGVPGERVWQTPPISFPDDADLRGPAELASFDAVRLFTERAGPLAATGDVPLRDLRVIAEITAQLDGIPLAIELAAARAAQLDLDQLAAVLQDRLGLSWLGSRTLDRTQPDRSGARSKPHPRWSSRWSEAVCAGGGRSRVRIWVG